MAHPGTEEYRRAAIALAASLRQSRFRGVIVSAATRGEGTTSAAVHIARLMLSEAGLNPVLIELNRLRPTFQKLFGLNPKLTLAKMLAQGGSALDYVQRDPTGLAVITAGVPGEDLPENGEGGMSLESGLCHAVQELQNNFDFVLLDAPPILESADVLLAGRVIPQLLLVVGAGRVSQENLSRACQQLQDAKIQLAGTILNSRRRFLPRWVERLLNN
jgi:polysaccharide biosynthesis transport protein